MTVRRAHPLQSEEQWVPGSRARGGPVALPVAMGQGGGAREGAYSLEYVDRLSGEPARLHAAAAACRLVGAANPRLQQKRS